MVMTTELLKPDRTSFGGHELGQRDHKQDEQGDDINAQPRKDDQSEQDDNYADDGDFGVCKHGSHSPCVQA